MPEKTKLSKPEEELAETGREFYSRGWIRADSGNFSLLRTLGQRYGFRAEKIDPVRYKDFVVSSTRIRRLIAEGRMDEAGALLGHQYHIDGVIVEGRRRGREIGFPTANLATANELIPPHGVYATTLTIDGIVHPGLTNIGLRPTFGETTETIETHVLGYSGDLYGAQVRLAFVQRLRDERKFDDVDALDRPAQIALARKVALGEMGVMTVSAGRATTLVASRRPPSPTSRITASAGRSAKASSAAAVVTSKNVMAAPAFACWVRFSTSARNASSMGRALPSAPASSMRSWKRTRCGEV